MKRTIITFFLFGILPILSCCSTTSTEKENTGIIIKDGDTIAFLGDSITNAGASYGKYCRLVIHGLKTKGINAKPVLAGIPGNTSEHMLGRLQKDVLSKKPDWVILAAGVNDIWHSDPTVKIGVFQPKPGMGVNLEDYKKNVTEIVDRCNKAGAKVMLTSITPILEDPEFKLNITSRKYNEFLYQLAKERNLPIAKLNEAMFAEIAKGEKLTSDGVHPLDNGHRIMAKGILKAMGLKDRDINSIEKEWINSPSIVILGDKQTTSGGRTGGWCHLLMDGMNSEKEMFTYQTIADYRKKVTLKSLIDSLQEKEIKNTRYLLLQTPKGDAELGTPLPVYRKELGKLVDYVSKKGLKLILITIPLQDNNVSSELNRKIEPYNDALQEISLWNRWIHFADINKAMKKQYNTDSETKLTFDGERFNHEGAILMAETIMRAMKLDSRITLKLKKIWEERPSYTDRYSKKKKN